MLWSIRWGVLVVGIFALMTALYFQDIYQLMVKSFSILMVGLFVPMTAALYWKKANAPAAIASIVFGVLSWIVLEFYKAITNQQNLPAELIAAGISLVALIVVTLLTEKKTPSLPATDIDGNIVEYKNRIGVLGWSTKTAVDEHE